MGEPIHEEINARERRFAELVSQMVMARILAAVCSPEVAERMAQTWVVGARRVLWRVTAKVAGYVVACAALAAAYRAGYFSSLQHGALSMIDGSDVSRHAPGVLGSLAALLWIKDTWPRRMGYVLAGSAASHYASPYAALLLNTDQGLAGFLIGLFSMAVAAKCFETIESVKAAEMFDRLLKRWGA
jgi:hypothetical protein